MKLPIMAENPRYAKYKIGIGTYGDPKVEDYGNHATLEIGSFCSIARDVTILLSGHHRIDWVTTSPLTHFFPTDRSFRLSHGHNTSKGNVVIGSDVWIGMGATIMGGVTIGHGAVIGAESVVTRDVQPYSIAAGNPAWFRRWRFSEDAIKRLLVLQWWEWPDEKIVRFLPLMLSTDIEAFLKAAEAEA